MIIKRLRETREILELKQIELTELYNVTSSTISGWEIGKDTIPLRQLIKYANKYSLSLDYLFGLTDINIKYEPINVNLEIIGKNLRHIRKSSGFTQQYVANILNTSQGSYAHYENARYLIPTSFLYNLTKVYKKISLDEILGRKKKQ